MDILLCYANFNTILKQSLGNNIVNILSASLATILFTTYFPKTGVSISTLVMTILILIFERNFS